MCLSREAAYGNFVISSLGILLSERLFDTGPLDINKHKDTVGSDRRNFLLETVAKEVNGSKWI